MDYDRPPDSPDYDDLEDLLEDLEDDRKLTIDDADIPSDVDDDDAPLPTIPTTQTQTEQSTATADSVADNGTPADITAKRRLEESIFGDLSDLDGSLEETAAKRPKRNVKKGEDDKLYDDLMERIRVSRTLPKTEQFVTGVGLESAPPDRPERPRISTRVPLRGDFQKLTFPDGTRYFLTVRSNKPQPVENVISSRTRLLSRPLQELKDEAERLEERRLRLQQEQAVLDKLERWSDAADSGIDSEDETEKTALWVQRFQPRRYVELLSEETINQGLLRWLKLWDKAVFGRDVVIKPKEEKKKPDGKFQPFVRKPAFEVVDELDSTNRPKQKAALLCGPPGLGKTTLAHVVAKHAGYNVLELNASDDRSVAAFRTALETATQMRPMLGRDPRPNCLVIDEIDGAPAPSINLLVSALTGGAGDSAAGGGSKKKRKDGPAPILRPVICICNDPYVPALRPLRQMALVMNFPPTAGERLASRLSDICRRNDLKTDMGALLALCDKTKNDIRACLSFLQFIRSRQDCLTLDQVQRSTVGLKDHHKSLFTAWHEVFNIPRPQRRHMVDDPDGTSRMKGDGTTLAERFNHMVSVVTSCGEYDKLAGGIFENYLNAKIRDASMRSVSLGTEWLCFGDEVGTELQRTQNYVLSPYQVYTGVAFHMLFASLQRMRPAFPQTANEIKQRQSKLTNLLATMVSEMSPRTRCFNSSAGLVMDVLPYLLQIAIPSLRPVNSQLHTPREAEELRRVLELMIAYNLTYRQQRDQEGQYQYVLEPNMEELVYFDEQRPQKSAPYTVKQLIAREIELEKMRRAEAALVGSETEQAVRAREAERREPAEPEPVPAAVPNHLRQLTAKPLTEKAENAAPRDFFGRIIESRQENAKQQSAEDAEASDAGRLLRTDVWYHFKEGYNNAVRRTVRVRDLA